MAKAAKPGGRPQDPVWVCFTRRESPTVPKAMCRGCNEELGAVVQRIKSYVLKRKGLSKKELKAAFPDEVGVLTASEIPSGHQSAAGMDKYHDFFPRG